MARLHNRKEPTRKGYANPPPSHSLYHSTVWKSIKKDVYAISTRCEYCRQPLKKYKTLDHFRPFRFWPELALEKRNLKPSCHSCHSRKSARETQAHTAREWERIVLPHYRIYDRMSFLNGKKGDKPP